jgi:hypothetical protein
MMLCPSCAAQTPPAVWSLIGAFMVLPLVVLGVVTVAVVIAVRRAASPAERSPAERSPPPPRAAVPTPPTR